MSKTISRVLVVLCTPHYTNDSRAELPRLITKFMIEEIQKKGIEVDLIDLYNEKDFNPAYQPEEENIKVKEFQIRLRKADHVIFVYPILWNHLPALLKGFIDRIFTPNFAFTKYKEITKPLLKNKSFWVVEFNERSSLEHSVIFNANLKLFWTRGVAATTGMSFKEHFILEAYKVAKEKRVQGWKKKLENKILKMNSTDSILDLL